jgi:hypothetical protein
MKPARVSCLRTLELTKFARTFFKAAGGKLAPGQLEVRALARFQNMSSSSI